MDSKSQRSKAIWKFEYQLIKTQEVAGKDKENRMSISLSKHIEKYQNKPNTLEQLVSTKKWFRKKGNAIYIAGTILAILASVVQIADTFLK